MYTVLEKKTYGLGFVEHNRLAWKHVAKVIYYFNIVIYFKYSKILFVILNQSLFVFQFKNYKLTS